MKAAQILRVSVASVGLLAASVAMAHHGGAGLDTGKVVTLTGPISKVEWSNPHIQIHLSVKDEQGKMEEWTLGWGAVNAVNSAGVTKEMLKVGAQVTTYAFLYRPGVSAAPGDQARKAGDAGCILLEKTLYRAGHGPPCPEPLPSK